MNETAAAADYTCSLSAVCLKQATEELNEDPQDRLDSVRAFRTWIQAQPHLACRTDTQFLLRFLRTAKFSQLRAREMLEGYLTLKIELPQWYNNWNPMDPDVTVFFKAGVFVPLPEYHNNGTKVLIHRYSALGRILPKTITKRYKNAYCRYWYMMMSSALQDENVQVSGLMYILDFSKFPMRGLTMFSMDETKEIMRFQDNMPGRFKGFWLYNGGTVGDALLALFRPFLKKKMLDRLHFCGNNLEKIYKEIPKHMLPKEYLPDDYDGPNAGSFDSLAADFYRDITEEKNVKALMYESDSKWGIDRSKKQADIPSVSFRKLNID